MIGALGQHQPDRRANISDRRLSVRAKLFGDGYCGAHDITRKVLLGPGTTFFRAGHSLSRCGGLS